MDDDMIIELFFKRSEQAIAELSGKYGGICGRVAYNILNNAEDAKECVNDAFLGVWNSIPPQKPQSLAAYVCRITRNVSLKRYRYNTAEKRNGFYDVSLSELEDAIPAKRPGAEPCGEEALTKLIESFLDTLDKKSRVMFVRRYWYEESVKALAEEFSVSEKLCCR